MMTERDIIVIGGGPAGLAAAAAAKESSAKSVLILERDTQPGGILNQCIHNGFGLHTFKEELTGPEYAARFIDAAEKAGVELMLESTVIDINTDLEITAVSPKYGLSTFKAKAVILAMGCRERPRGALNIPGTRPAGIYSAGTAQRLMNIEGYRVGSEVVILGSGDIGLIMARRMTLEGAKVKVVAEVMPYSGGLKRNIVQCLDDFGIPLKLSHTVVKIHGKERVTGVTIAQVGPDRKPVAGTEEYYSCDTLLLSVGLIPENELTGSIGAGINRITNGPTVNDLLETSVPGVFACGNVLHVHDLVDNVTAEAAQAGHNAARHISGSTISRPIDIIPENGVRYTVPQRIDPDSCDDEVLVRFRVSGVFTGRSICVYCDDRLVLSKKRRIMAPGEMETVTLKKADLNTNGRPGRIVIRTEGAE